MLMVVVVLASGVVLSDLDLACALALDMEFVVLGTVDVVVNTASVSVVGTGVGGKADIDVGNGIVVIVVFDVGNGSMDVTDFDIATLVVFVVGILWVEVFCNADIFVGVVRFIMEVVSGGDEATFVMDIVRVAYSVEDIVGVVL